MKPMIPLRDEFYFPLEQTFNKFFDDFFNTRANVNVAKSNLGYPKINTYFEDDTYKICFAVPGLTTDELEVEYGDNRIVTIFGKTAHKYQSATASYTTREIRLSSFERSVQLPEGVNGEPVNAVLADGILTLTWKLTPKDTKNKIRIQLKSE